MIAVCCDVLCSIVREDLFRFGGAGQRNYGALHHAGLLIISITHFLIFCKCFSKNATVARIYDLRFYKKFTFLPLTNTPWGYIIRVDS